MVKIAELAARTKMTVHGGQDYCDEKARFFNTGHPILTIEMDGEVRHFKCTSVDTSHKGRMREGYYLMRNPETCQLDQTYKAIAKPGFVPAVDFNHSVYLRNDETPPLKIYPDGDTDNPQDQTRFEVSQEDKEHILKHLFAQVNQRGRAIRRPEISKEECESNDRYWNNRQGHVPYKIQVITEPEVSLNLDDLQPTVRDRLMQ